MAVVSHTLVSPFGDAALLGCLPCRITTDPFPKNAGKDRVRFMSSNSQNNRLSAHDEAVPRFLQGAFPFAGRGLFDLAPLDDELVYIVPEDCGAKVVYFRGGNHSDDLLYLVLAADGIPTRYFPVGPKGDFHVALAIVEIHPAGTRLEILIAAPRGLSGTVIVDAGILESRSPEAETR